MRIICSGQILEDIDGYSRLHEMFHMLKSSNKRLNDGIEGFGTKDDGTIETVGVAASRTVCFPNVRNFESKNISPNALCASPI